MVHSSTDPCVVVIAGGLVGLNRAGGAPSTVMKNWPGFSEKYNVRWFVTGAFASKSKRCGLGDEDFAGIKRGSMAFGFVFREMSGRAGMLSPAEPLSTVR